MRSTPSSVKNTGDRPQLIFLRKCLEIEEIRKLLINVLQKGGMWYNITDS